MKDKVAAVFHRKKGEEVEIYPIGINRFLREAHINKRKAVNKFSKLWQIYDLELETWFNNCRFLDGGSTTKC